MRYQKHPLSMIKSVACILGQVLSRARRSLNHSLLYAICATSSRKPSVYAGVQRINCPLTVHFDRPGGSGGRGGHIGKPVRVQEIFLF